ncbi:MAG: ATP-dependent DNA ligase [Myxococcota bacterium]
MKRFAELFDALDRTNATSEKVAHMVAYFREVASEDGAWAVFFLTGGRLRRLIGPRTLGAWAGEVAQLPEWLLGECYDAVGDGAETIALLLEGQAAEATHEVPALAETARSLEALRTLDESAQRAAIESRWRALPRLERLLFTKMMTGSLRVGVSKLLVVRALAELSGLEREVIEHRLVGDFEPTAERFGGLLRPDDGTHLASKPYPFFLASPLDEPEEIGPRDAFIAEWKWDGIRAQLLHRAGKVALWSRGEERIEERFPDIDGTALPDGTALDGELLVWDFDRDRPADFGVLQTRINRKRLSKNLLAKSPARFVAYDLLEADGEDLRSRSLRERRGRLEAVVAELDPRAFAISAAVTADSWDGLRELRKSARKRGVEGLMLKRLDAPYRSGRRRGDWWKWKLEPLTLDCVLTMAQSGSGKRAGRFTDYTFGLWRGEGAERTLVTIAKAYSGLDDEEIAELDKWIRRHTVERFGPVRAVEPMHVFEIGFEGMRESKRHKAGLAVRFPRILRWRRDKRAEDASTLADAHELRQTFAGE